MKIEIVKDNKDYPHIGQVFSCNGLSGIFMRVSEHLSIAYLSYVRKSPNYGFVAIDLRNGQHSLFSYKDPNTFVILDQVESFRFTSRKEK